LASLDEIKRTVLSLLATDDLRSTPNTLFKSIRRRFPDCTLRMIRSTLKLLLEEGAISYSHHCSISQLELNYQKPIKISNRLMLCPHANAAAGLFNGVRLKLEPGASFGQGDHPTTRLALRGVDVSVRRLSNRSEVSQLSALDIGTGSGVLAIAAVLLGMGNALGIDTDSLARREARLNVILNGLEKRIHIDNTPLEHCAAHEKYSLILANLRPPTLKEIFPAMRTCTSAKGIWVLSGFRPQEKYSLFGQLEKSERLFWEAEEKNWAAAAFIADI
jgi:ribosomal protein L11 methyltransferase